MALPLRTHHEFISQAREVSESNTKAEAERLAKDCGIKGVPILCTLDSMRFPDAFPGDFMHNVLENVIPELVDLWSNQYKGIDAGREDYHLPTAVLAAINQSISKSSDTIPSSFGSRTPPLHDRYQYTAESWSHWALYIAPVVLRGRFSKDTYYKHFIELVVSMQTCLSLSVTDADVNALEHRLARWVQRFEK
jgi:hypothetical protein